MHRRNAQDVGLASSDGQLTRITIANLLFGIRPMIPRGVLVSV
ncbi:hypothetical protein [Vibrio cidicii]|nr:hypothetical protein [Vibrio cidicii]